jgi:hypothetical protein
VEQGPYAVTWKDESNTAPWMETLTVNVPGFEVGPMVHETEQVPETIVQGRSFVVEPDAYTT